MHARSGCSTLNCVRYALARGSMAALVAVISLGMGGCDRDDTEKKQNAEASSPKPASAQRDEKKKPEKKAPKPEPEKKQPEEQCPEGMAEIPGGPVTMGTLAETYEEEENPRFVTRLPKFCADLHEMSAAEYQKCIDAGKCTPSDDRYETCNTVEKGRGDHPINCIDHGQAKNACEFYDKRLPTEVEWVYLARGGKEMRKYPWGDEHPDGNTCWKHAGSCERGSYPPGAFGLYDVVGNVWEWTDSWFGHYPWPEPDGRHKVYRGGSWSRRFVKWMRPTLRNRLNPEKSGSHLGVRCVKSLKKAKCPYGRNDEGKCRYGIDEVDCLHGKEWNGIRCARPGDDRRCLPGYNEVAGHGCVRKPVEGEKADYELDLSAVKVTRSPKFDADCQKNTPGRPHAYQLTGGGHLARNLVGRKRGCKNRDVGVGWNSACCP